MGTYADMGGPVVLVVEDNPALRRLLSDSLELNGYTVHVAADASAGLRMARSLRPDLILTDIGLPGMDGIEFARRVREDRSQSRVPILTMTARDTPEVLDRVRQAGLHGPLVKPINLPRLASRVAMLAGNAFAIPL